MFKVPLFPIAVAGCRDRFFRAIVEKNLLMTMVKNPRSVCLPISIKFTAKTNRVCDITNDSWLMRFEFILSLVAAKASISRRTLKLLHE